MENNKNIENKKEEKGIVEKVLLWIFGIIFGMLALYGMTFILPMIFYSVIVLAVFGTPLFICLILNQTSK